MFMKVFYKSKLSKIFIVFLTLSLCVMVGGQSLPAEADTTFSWSTIGNDSFSNGQTSAISFALDSHNTPYVAFQDLAANKAISVKKFNGTKWVYLGTRGFTNGESDTFQLTVDHNDVPVLSYVDKTYGYTDGLASYNETNNRWDYMGNTGVPNQDNFGVTRIHALKDNNLYWVYRYQSVEAQVKRFDGELWTDLPSLTCVWGGDLITDHDKVLYSACPDPINSYKVNVQKLVDGSWESVGDGVISSTASSNVTLAVDSKNYIFVAYSDAENSNATIIKYFNGTAWNTISTSGFVGKPNLMNFAIDSSDHLYVTYSDQNDNGTVYLYKYNGTSWTELRASSTDTDMVRSLILKMDGNQAPYIAYQDYDDLNSAYLTKLDYLPVASQVAVSGTKLTGQTFTGSYTYSIANGTSEGSSTYQWYRANDAAGTGSVAITGATSKTYVAQDADYGKYLIFKVTAVAASGDVASAATSSATYGPIASAPKATSVKIKGSNIVGSKLTASYTYSDLASKAESGTSFQWYRATDELGTGSVAISGATAKTYTVTTTDRGKYVYVKITPSATGSIKGTVVKSPYFGEINTPPTASTVKITGTAKVGQKLTGSYTYYDEDGETEATSVYQWYRATNNKGTGLVAISGATSKTYTLVAADKGKYISFSVKPVASAGEVQGTATSSTYVGAVN